MDKYAEQIAAFEAKRASIVAEMEALMKKASDEGTTLDEEQQQAYDGYEADIEAIDGHLKRLRALEKAVAKTPVAGKTSDEGRESRTVHPTVKATPKEEPGVRFARVVKSLGIAKGNLGDAVHVAERAYPNDPAIATVLKASVAAGTTSNSTWAGALVGDETSIFADFVEYLRPQTILGRFGQNGVPALRRVPFRVPLIGQTSGGQGYWVGEGAAKPLTKFDFSRTTLEPLKVANIAVLTEEVIRDSSPSADVIVRDQLAAALRARLDTDFIDPGKAAVNGVSPASITNGVTPTASSGTDADAVRADIKALFDKFIAGNNAPTSGVWIMSATTALSLSLMMNALGQPEFPGIDMNGGRLFGLPVIVSEYVPQSQGGSPLAPDGRYVFLVNASDIYLGDEGGIEVAMSREASLAMDDAPTMNSTTPTPAQLVSMFQTNSVAFRAERTINWARRRADAVAVLSGVNWGAAS